MESEQPKKCPSCKKPWTVLLTPFAVRESVVYTTRDASYSGRTSVIHESGKLIMMVTCPNPACLMDIRAWWAE